MSKRTTKRDLILEGIDKEIASVKADISTAEAEMAVYRSNLSSLYAVEHALEKLREKTATSLAPQPRQSAGTQVTTNSDTVRTPKQPPLCAHIFKEDGAPCKEPKDSPVHENGHYTDYHKFVPPLKKSSTKKRAGLPSENVSPRRCCATVDDNGGEMTCGKPENDSVHDLTYLSSHPFLAPSPARNAQQSSPANGAAQSFIPNTVDGTDDAAAVAGGSSD